MSDNLRNWLKHFCETFRSLNNNVTRILDEELRDLDLFVGINCKIRLCCIIFYELAWLPSIKKQIPEYSEKIWKLAERRGVILCPECLIKKLNNKQTEKILEFVRT